MAHPTALKVPALQYSTPHLPILAEPAAKAVARHLLRTFGGPLPTEVLCACLLAMRAYTNGDSIRLIFFPREYEHSHYGPGEQAQVVIGRWRLPPFVPLMPGSEPS